MSDERLFAVAETPISMPAKPLSATRKLTIRNQALLERGIHPATRGRVTTDGTCGTCEHCHRYDYHRRIYFKCAQHRLGESHSAASDIRKSWPSCELYREVADA